MAIAVGQSVKAAGATVTSVTTAGINTTAGNLLVAGLAYYGTFSSITDNNTETWEDTYPERALAVQGKIKGSYAKNIIGRSGHTFTLTLTGSGYPTIVMREVTGATATPLDQVASIADTVAGTSHTSPNVTTTENDELLCGDGSSEESTTFTTDTGAGWVNDQNESTGTNEGIISDHRVVASTGTYAYTFTTGTSPTAAQGIATFKAVAAGAAAVVRHQRSLCGVGR